MKNSNTPIDTIAIFFQRCWLVGAIVAIAAMVWLADEPAWAGPHQQFTVPTATPTSFDEPDEELVPTPTPEPLFEPEPQDDNSDNFDTNDDFDLPVEEPTEEPSFFDEDPEIIEPDPQDESLFDDFNNDDSEVLTDDFGTSQPDNSEPADTGFENIPTDNSEPADTGFEDTPTDNTFDPIEDLSNTDDFTDSFDSVDGTGDAASLGGAAGGSAASGSAAGGASLDDEPAEDLFEDNFGSGNSGTVSISVLNIRRDPSPDADIIDTLWRNDVVEITQTANGGTWLLVCCGVEQGSAGWVSGLFINHDTSSLNVSSLSATELATEIETGGETSSATTIAEPTAATSLELTMSVTDTTVLAGQILDISYAVENIGSIDAQNIRLSNELPEDLYLNNFEMDATGQFTHTINTQNNRRIFNIIWSEIAASGTVTATVKVQVAPGATNGLVIDNLAGVDAENADGDTAAISIGTPPLAPPSFRSR